MIAIRLSITAAVALSLLAGTATGADDKSPPEPKRTVVLPVAGIDADEVVGLLAKRLPGTRMMRVPWFDAIAVWGTDEEILMTRELLRPL